MQDAAARDIELLGCRHEARVGLLNYVQEMDAAIGIAARHRGRELQVRFDKPFPGSRGIRARSDFLQ